MDEWVFVDTCIWASFFGKPGSPEKAGVNKLLDADRVAIAGPIVAEVLLGFRRKDQADWVASRLRITHYVETRWDDWQAAADLGRDFASKGHKVRLTDLICRRLSAALQCLGVHIRSPFRPFCRLEALQPEPAWRVSARQEELEGTTSPVQFFEPSEPAHLGLSTIKKGRP